MPTLLPSPRLATIIPNFQDTISVGQSKIDYRHHLIVHFDINETILVGDEAGGDSREESLHKILAKSAFVEYPIITEDDDDDVGKSDLSNFEPSRWWDGSPILQTYLDSSPIPALYTGWQWPLRCVPYYRTAFKKRAKNFCEHDGSIYLPTFEAMKQMLHRHDTLDAPSGIAPPLILNHMIPAFFETMVALSDRSVRQKISIVFRTFGSDLPQVAEAISWFAQGQHPMYPNFVNKSFMLSPEALYQAKWSEKPSSDEGEDGYVYQLFHRGRLVASGDAEVVQLIHSHAICGIQDDYPFWKQNGYEPWAGKPIWKFQSKTVQHVLFDDNIHNLENDSIACVRVCTGDDQGHANMHFRSLHGHEILQEQGRHLIRVPTVAPILDPTWFLRMIDQAQDAFCLHES